MLIHPPGHEVESFQKEEEGHTLSSYITVVLCITVVWCVLVMLCVVYHGGVVRRCIYVHTEA